MKKTPLLTTCFVFCWFATLAQRQDTTAAKNYLFSLVRFIDHSVVAKNKAALDTLYADDFVFTHGTGLVDNKKSWMTTVMKPEMRYISREHDSTLVELHGDVAIIFGRLSIQRQDKDSVAKYGVKYVRVFAYRNRRWQMISHKSTYEWHE